MHPVCYWIGAFLLFPHRFGECQVFRSLTELEAVVGTEKNLVEMLERYIYVQKLYLRLLTSYVKTHEKERNMCLENASACVQNPINAYLLIKRLTMEWEQIDYGIRTNHSKEFLNNISRLKFPTLEDLTGAREALIRLRNIYDLDVTSFTNGEVGGVKYDIQLTASDCLEIGKQSLDTNKLDSAQIWLQEAYAKLGENGCIIDKVSILDDLASTSYKKGNTSQAVYFINKLLDISPNDQKALKSKDYYENLLISNNESHNFENSDSVISADDINSDTEISIDDTEEYLKGLFQKACRGERIASEDTTAKLKCKYVNNSNPFLFLAPFKLEELSLDPLKIFRFHDILSDKEIQLLVEESRIRFENASVTSILTGSATVSDERIGRVAWLTGEHQKHFEVIDRRVSHMTGLDTTTAEEFQVSNYGIGGHFSLHVDYFRKESMPQAFEHTGNRIATVLFYFNDNVQGGSTVFPYANVTIQPKKGTATLWYNLKLSGERNVNTTHGSCPVITGSKWIMTKWIHEVKQEFVRPCGLTMDAPDYEF